MKFSLLEKDDIAVFVIAKVPKLRMQNSQGKADLESANGCL